ncbi:MAG: ATP-binding protein [Anaerolineales bacterium]
MRLSTDLPLSDLAAAAEARLGGWRVRVTALAAQLQQVSRLRTKLVVPYFLLTLLIAAVGTFITTWLVSSSVEERFKNQLFQAGRVAEEGIVRQETEHLNNLRLMAFTEGVADALARQDADGLERLLLPIVVNNGVEVVAVLDGSGASLLTLALNLEADQYLIEDQTDLSTFEPVARVLRGEVDTEGDKFVGFLNTDRGPYFFTAAPVRAAGQPLAGVLMIGTRMQSLLAKLKQQSLADVVVLDATGDFVASTLPESEEGYGALALSPSERAGVDGSPPRELQLYGRGFGLVYSTLEFRRTAVGVIGVVLSRDYVVETGATNRNAILVFFLVLMLAVSLLGYGLARMIAKPILRLREVSQAVAAGDLEQHTGLRQADEIGDLAGAFDVMTLRLRERTAEAARLYDETLRHNTELAEAYDKLRRTQQQLIQSEKLSAIGQLTAGIVHDVKNPLAVIKGVVELIEDDPAVDELNRKNLGQITEQVNRANRIVSDLMKFARQSNLEMLPGDMRTTMETVVRLTSYMAKQGRVKVVSDLPAQVIIATYDAPQIEQVLVNLVQNAVQAMPNGGTLRLNLSQAGQTVAIAVQDSGSGISPENLSKIFDPFFTTKPAGEGTGLGLAVSYGIVANHGGKIDVETAPGRGTTFTVLLPRDPPQPVATDEAHYAH